MKLIDMRDPKIANQVCILKWDNVHNTIDPFDDTAILFQEKIYYLTQTYGGWSIAENLNEPEDSLLIDCLGNKTLMTLYEEGIRRGGDDGPVDVLDEDMEVDE